MDWNHCNIFIDNKMSSSKLYEIFHNVYGCRTQYVLLRMMNEVTHNMFYKTMRIDEKRERVIIGDEELYVWYYTFIIDWCPLENDIASKTPKFQGTIYVDGKQSKTYDNEDDMFDDWDDMASIRATYMGNPVYTESDVKQGFYIYYDEKSQKATVISYKTNRQ